MLAYRFALITKGTDSYWSQLLRQALEDIGTLDTIPETDAAVRLAAVAYNLILIEASEVQDVLTVIRKIKKQHPDLRIIVVTSTTTWQSVREFFKAGASDYMNKSTDRFELSRRLVELLQGSSPNGEVMPGIQEHINGTTKNPLCR